MALKPQEQFKYRSGVGKLLHMIRFSRPETMNVVRELSRFMTVCAADAHTKALYRVMKYCLDTPERGWKLEPNRKFDGSPKFELEITGYSDSDYAKDSDTRKSVSGNATFLNGAPVIAKIGTQRIVTLSITEAELFSAITNAQDMMFVKRVVESIGLKVKLPMILTIDNKGTVDLINNNSVDGRTMYVETRQYYLRGLKEEGTISAIWGPGLNNCADLYTKYLERPEFEKHTRIFVGHDQYMKKQE
jgi:hypothetical protein